MTSIIIVCSMIHAGPLELGSVKSFLEKDSAMEMFECRCVDMDMDVCVCT